MSASGAGCGAERSDDPLPARRARPAARYTSDRCPENSAEPAYPWLRRHSRAGCAVVSASRSTCSETHRVPRTAHAPFRLTGASSRNRISHRFLGEVGRRGFFNDVPLSPELLDFIAKPIQFRRLGLHLALARKRLRRVRSLLLHPLPQQVLVHPRSRAACATVTPRYVTSFTASSLYSRLNTLRIPMDHLRFHHHTQTRCP